MYSCDVLLFLNTASHCIEHLECFSDSSIKVLYCFVSSESSSDRPSPKHRQICHSVSREGRGRGRGRGSWKDSTPDMISLSTKKNKRAGKKTFVSYQIIA